MFQNITISALWSDASLEIIIMLLWAFILWYLLCYVLLPKQDKKTKNSIHKSWKKAILPWIVNTTKKDDLQLIEWIWPALEKVLQNNGVSSYKDIVSLDISGLEDLLESLGGRYTSYNPTTWPDQALLAKRKKWSELEEYQEIMKNSKKKTS